jgi:hypothetical protein
LVIYYSYYSTRNLGYFELVSLILEYVSEEMALIFDGQNWTG